MIINGKNNKIYISHNLPPKLTGDFNHQLLIISIIPPLLSSREGERG